MSPSQATVIVLITCSLLVTSRQYIGGQLSKLFHTTQILLERNILIIPITMLIPGRRWPHWLHCWPRRAPKCDGHLLLDSLHLQHSQPIRGSQWGIFLFQIKPVILIVIVSRLEKMFLIPMWDQRRRGMNGFTTSNNSQIPSQQEYPY